MNAPKTFHAGCYSDPEDWIEEFRLVAKLNKWVQDDWVDFVKLYLGNNEKVWYKKNKSTFTSWENFVEVFVKKFAVVKSKSQIWGRLRTIKQDEFDTVEELELELTSLLDSAKVTEVAVRTDWLLSTLRPESLKVVENENISSWSEIITRLIKEEVRSTSFNKGEYKESQAKPKEYNRNAASKSGKNVKELVKDQKPLGQFMKMFNELSVNLLNKVDEVVDKKIKEAERNRPRFMGPRKVVCYNCQKDGHTRNECPELIKFTKEEPIKVESEKSVNYIQIADESDLIEQDIFSVEKRKNSPENYERVRKPGRPRIQETHPQQNQNTDKSTSSPSVVENSENIMSKSDNNDTFSIIKELEKVSLKVNVLQLLNNSASMKEEMVEYINNKRISEVNEFEVEAKKLSNCKALVKVFGQSIWAVVDTGAACSVVTSNLVEEWGLSPDSYSKQVIVTADGKRHTTLGKVSDVPLKVSSFMFPVNLWVMDRNEDILILGTDWLLEHRVSLNLRIPELRLPIENAEITTKLAMFTYNTVYKEEQELYLLCKEETVSKIEANPEEFKEVLNEFKDIFVDDISELQQSDVMEHRIDLIDETPIKLRPYRMPQKTQEKEKWDPIA
ncbi:DNA damage-inducible protein 1 [Zancudomyces culisetae]|uniref:DNA damage-inducible protein 1 n=1 Tax=Zancudomyces culisetae TaxID=1213189 RepID=A0A1R1PE54_ZANCU|nr:DNA damage-inducible protein 1 [Zancudomyces culisetae]|eukprot:OMH79257.1 DNA damage-inducible protein 1 [Zancudomyces culisetae]